MASISALQLDRISLEATWDDGITTRYPWIWLRDHAHDEATLHPVTQQRELFTATLSADLAATSASVEGDALVVSWSDDGTTSALPVAFLARHRIAAAARTVVEAPITLWDAAYVHEHLPRIPYASIMDSDRGVRDWLLGTFEYGFSLAVDTPATPEATEALLRRIGYVRQTIFGGMWGFSADMTMADTAYTALELRPHTDGTYSHDAPGMQMLHCMKFEGSGGESTMVDAFMVADRMRRDSPAHYDTLSRVVVPGQYIGDGSHLMAARPVFRHDHTGSLVQVSFNNYDRAPFLLAEDEMIAFYDALREFERLANHASMQWRHVLAPGEAMLFDNWRVLHGRCSFTGDRRMCGGYLNREDAESRLRQLL